MVSHGDRPFALPILQRQRMGHSQAWKQSEPGRMSFAAMLGLTVSMLDCNPSTVTAKLVM